MTVSAIIDALQKLHRTIEGVKLAPAKYPGSINSADLPLVIVWPGRATTKFVTTKGIVIRSERMYSVRVYVEAVGQNDYDTPARDGITLLQRFLERYMRESEIAQGYPKILEVSDSGLTAGGEAGLVYAGSFYKGFVCDLTVLELLAP